MRVYDIQPPKRDETIHVGETHGKLKIIGLEYPADTGKRQYTVKCTTCGTLLHGMTMSQIKAEANTKCIHMQIGKYRANWSCPRLRSVYINMVYRCYNTKHPSYHNYGGKGITVCDDWLNNPQSFNDWAIKTGYADNMIIDRIDVSKSYSPDNCKWTVKPDNRLTKPATVRMAVNGTDMTLAEWSRSLGYERTYLTRFYRKYGEDATRQEIINNILTGRNKPYAMKKYITINGVTLTLTDWGRKLGMANIHHFMRYAQRHSLEETSMHIRDVIEHPDRYGNLFK